MLRSALQIVAYAQGFEPLSAAAAAYEWTLHLGTIAAIRRGGYTICARFPDRIKEAYDADPRLGFAAGSVFQRRGRSMPGIPVPAFSYALVSHDGFRRERGPANLIGGLRDYVGVNTYRRTDGLGSFHTRWAQDGAPVKTG